MKPIVLAITGASGAVYAARLLDVLVAAGRDVELSISPAGQAVMAQELEIDVDLDNFQLEKLLPTPSEYAASPSWRRLRGLMGTEPGSPARSQPAGPGRVRYHHFRGLMAPIASGSHLTDGIVVCPCSGGTASAIAHAASTNLIHRAADVHLKERRKLVLVPRETPMSLPQIDNLRKCAEAGAIVLPAMPGWYHGVRGLRDLIDFVVARACDQLQVEHSLMKRWGA
jgi:4-hydroxy-3-polyprenylbenzoate decarboxylase